MKSTLTLTEAKARAQAHADYNQAPTLVEETPLGLGIVTYHLDLVPFAAIRAVAFPQGYMDAPDWTEALIKSAR